MIVRNNGPSMATGVALALPLPSGWTVTSTLAPCASGFPCSIGNLAAGATLPVYVYVSVPAGSQSSVPYNITATVTSSSTDPVTANKSATTQTAVTAVVVQCPTAISAMQPTGPNVPTAGTLTWLASNADSYSVYLGP